MFYGENTRDGGQSITNHSKDIVPNIRGIKGICSALELGGFSNKGSCVTPLELH